MCSDQTVEGMHGHASRSTPSYMGSFLYSHKVSICAVLIILTLYWIHTARLANNVAVGVAEPPQQQLERKLVGPRHRQVQPMQRKPDTQRHKQQSDDADSVKAPRIEPREAANDLDCSLRLAMKIASASPPDMRAQVIEATQQVLRSGEIPNKVINKTLDRLHVDVSTTSLSLFKHLIHHGLRIMQDMKEDKYMDVGMIALNKGGVQPFIRTTTSLFHFATVQLRLHVIVNDESEKQFKEHPWITSVGRHLQDAGVLLLRYYNVKDYNNIIDVSKDAFRGGSTGNALHHV